VEKKISIIENILRLVEDGISDYWTQEKATDFIKAVNVFLNNIKVEEQDVVLERHETEEEAREYFGQGEMHYAKYEGLLN